VYLARCIPQLLGRTRAKLWIASIIPIVATKVETCHDLFYSVKDAEEYIEEQNNKSVDDDQCPLRVGEIVELNEELHKAH
jgi:hypothetical protein